MEGISKQLQTCKAENSELHKVKSGLMTQVSELCKRLAADTAELQQLRGSAGKRSGGPGGGHSGGDGGGITGFVASLFSWQSS